MAVFWFSKIYDSFRFQFGELEHFYKTLQFAKKGLKSVSAQKVVCHSATPRGLIDIWLYA